MKISQPCSDVIVDNYFSKKLHWFEKYLKINITLKYLDLYVKRILHTCKCSFSYFSLLYATK